MYTLHAPDPSGPKEKFASRVLRTRTHTLATAAVVAAAAAAAARREEEGVDEKAQNKGREREKSCIGSRVRGLMNAGAAGDSRCRRTGRTWPRSLSLFCALFHCPVASFYPCELNGATGFESFVSQFGK